MVRYKPGAMGAESDLRQIEPPDLDSARRRIEAFLRAREGTALGWTVALPTTAAVIVAAMGFENYYTAVRENPAFVENFLDRIEEKLFPVTENIVGTSGILSVNVSTVPSPSGCTVKTTAEIVLWAFEGVVYRRTIDPDTGFKELEVE